jgi:predicted nucleic acid-binding protein
MYVVSNISPISNLAIIGRLDLLRTRFGKILIPTAVRAELGRLSHSEARQAIEEALRLGWLAVQPIGDQDMIRVLSSSLDGGEAEAIALAVEISADWIILDEADGRKAASRAGLNVTGVLGILARAKHRGEIALLKPELDALRAQGRFFISPRVERDVLRLVGE